LEDGPGSRFGDSESGQHSDSREATFVAGVDEQKIETYKEAAKDADPALDPDDVPPSPPKGEGISSHGAASLVPGGQFQPGPHGER